jgi:thiol:disulfide interchange protein DsbD
MRYFAVIALLLHSLGDSGIAAENPLRVKLVSESTSIQPGKPFYVGLHLQHPPGYHTYWKFPGIVGIPTGITWNLPEGWKAGDIEWPEPERVLMFQIKAQGFHGEKLLPIRITPPGNLRPGATARLEGKARWMCCGRECNPGFQDLSIDLPISAEATPEDRRWSPIFAESLAAVAQTSPEWTTETARTGGEITLRVKPASAQAKLHLPRIKEVTFFTEDGVIDPNKPGFVTNDGGEIVITQTISEYAPKPLPGQIAGILQTPQGWLPDGMPKSIRIATPLRK